MEVAQDTFISSTFWTERIGPTAAIATLDVMEQAETWDTISTTGERIREYWKLLASRYGFELKHSGLPALCCFAFENDPDLVRKTVVSQEMLKRGYLASNSVYVSTAHTKEIVDGYFGALDEVFHTLKLADDRENIADLLDGQACHKGFNRLN